MKMQGNIQDHDLVRRTDRHGEVLMKCRKCSRYARQRKGPKLMNCCKPEPMGTQEYGKMKNGGVPAKEANHWRIEGQKKRITRKECQRLVNNFGMEGFMSRKGLWNLAREEKKVTPLESTRLCMKYIS